MTYAEFDKLLVKALEYAKIYHHGQKYGDKTYLYHLYAVQTIFVEFGYYPNENNEELGYIFMIAALLHDILEDTEVTYEELEKEFGLTIAKLVWRVTNEEGLNRRERNEKTYPKIREDVNAVALKLADRLANVRFSSQTQENPLIKMYQKEWKVFRESLDDKINHQELWKAIDDLLNIDNNLKQ